jgi:hypothetical protein
MKVRYVNVLPVRRNTDWGYMIDPNDGLILGCVYTVFGIELQLSGPGYVTIQYGLDMVPNKKEIQLFEIVDPAIPNDWVISIPKNGYYCFEPKSFVEFSGDFWEHYYCNDDRAENIFEQERERLENFHAQRNCSLQIPSSSNEQLNALASTNVREILSNGVRTTGAGGRYPNGWVTYTLPDGRAASWTVSGEFIGFRGLQK